jgi:hypothetical protein
MRLIGCTHGLGDHEKTFHDRFEEPANEEERIERNWRGPLSRLMLCLMYPVGYEIIVFGPRSVAAWLGLPTDLVISLAIGLALGIAEVLLVWDIFRDIRANWLSRALAKRVSKRSSRGLDDAWLDGPR